MAKKPNPIDAALGLRPLEEIQEAEVVKEMTPVVSQQEDPLPPVVVDDEVLPLIDQEVVRDVEKARENILDLIDIGKDSLEELVTLAKQSEKARDFEVASGMIKTLLDANKQFVEAAEKKRDIHKENRKGDIPQGGAVTNNNTLILSTVDALKMIRGEEIEHE